MSKQNYMPAIDGLRSIAVAAVIIFHFFPKLLKGGYVGVDIFFVISGYLVTGIILKSLKNQSFNIVQFYTKRISRLLPALALVVATISILGFLLLLSKDLKQTGLHIFSGAFFFSNFQYFTEAGYFDKSSELKPFLHLWSLSLEEQFYFIWPFVLLALSKILTNERSKYLKYALTLICLISFGACAVLTKNNQSLTFFNLPFRIWELGIGGLLAVLQNENFIDEAKYKKQLNILSYLGLLLVVYAMLTYTDQTVFPGMAATLPVFGTI